MQAGVECLLRLGDEVTVLSEVRRMMGVNPVEEGLATLQDVGPGSEKRTFFLETGFLVVFEAGHRSRDCSEGPSSLALGPILLRRVRRKAMGRSMSAIFGYINECKSKNCSSEVLAWCFYLGQMMCFFLTQKT
jgi:hypothetical protein